MTGQPDLSDFVRAERLAPAFAETVGRLHAPLAALIAERARRRSGMLVVGLTGPQGSGKSTMAAVLERLLAARSLRVFVLALDDLYLPRAERLRLAAEVHPLLATRGVPGTHDAALGAEVLERLSRPGEILLPRFDKASDDRLPADAWTRAAGPFDVVLFEGWCVGARPQALDALRAPVNALERDRDPDGVWRAYANTALAGPYAALFAPIGLQALLRAPRFETVLAWRLEQERKLRARLAQSGGRARGQSDAEIAVFVRCYERITRHVDAEMPARADVVVELDEARRPIAARGLDLA